MKKAQSGITLIALVVTIVVLLILAGITIAFVLSDGGIFQSAQQAKIEQTGAAIRDYVGQINGVVSARYWANIADNADTKEVELILGTAGTETSKVGIKDFFPKDDNTYSITELKNTAPEPADASSVKCDSNGMIKNASFKVTKDKHEFSVEFDATGVVTVKYTGDATEAV